MRSLPCALFLTVVLVFAASVSWSATPPKKQTAETATQFYLRWRTTALNAKSMGEITPFWTADTIEEFNMMPDSAARAETLAMVKRFFSMQTDVTVIKETATPNGATLSLEALDRDRKPVISSVDIVKENGAWKITAAVEQWKPKDN
jgi:hypothetical protein